MKQFALIKIDNPKVLHSITLVGIFDSVEEAAEWMFGGNTHQGPALTNAREQFTGSLSVSLAGITYVLLEEE